MNTKISFDPCIKEPLHDCNYIFRVRVDADIVSDIVIYKPFISIASERKITLLLRIKKLKLFLQTPVSRANPISPFDEPYELYATLIINFCAMHT